MNTFLYELSNHIDIILAVTLIAGLAYWMER